MNSSEQEAMMESDEDEQMDNGPQNGIDEDLDSSQGKVSNCFLIFLIVRFFSKIPYTVWYTVYRFARELLWFVYFCLDFY